MQDQESNIITQWVRGLFEVEPHRYNYSTYLEPNGEDHYDITDNSNMENDEIIARMLQEDFSQLALTESSHYSNSVEPRVDNWNSMPTNNYSSGFRESRAQREESDDVAGSSWCSSPSGNREEWTCSAVSSDEYGLDNDEINRRLNQMNFISHVPRINGEIPSIDEATSDHERLEIRLQDFGFVEVKVEGDGNCQFRALSDQLYHTPNYHESVRQQVVNQLKLHRDIYEGYVPMDYDDYLSKISRSGEWGDHVTLQAAADSHGVEIRVVTSYERNSCIDILPGNQKPKKTIFLSFWAEVHYNSIYPQEVSETTYFRKKKKWWNFGK